MNDPEIDYKGYRIYAAPMCGNDGKWYGAYDITKDGTSIRSRTHVFPGFLYREAAAEDSIEQAKLEIDELVAFQGHSR